MHKLFGTTFEFAIFRKLNGMKLAAGQVADKVKQGMAETGPYSKCHGCGKNLTITEVYGEWEDYCIDCYAEESSEEK